MEEEESEILKQSKPNFFTKALVKYSTAIFIFLSLIILALVGVVFYFGHLKIAE